MGRRRVPAGSLAEGDQVRDPLLPKIHFVSVLVLKSHVCVCLDPVLLVTLQVSPFLDLPRVYICGIRYLRRAPVPAGLSLSSVRPPGGVHLWDRRSAGEGPSVGSRLLAGGMRSRDLQRASLRREMG